MMDDGLIEMKTVMLIMVMLIKRLCSVGKPFPSLSRVFTPKAKPNAKGFRKR